MWEQNHHATTFFVKVTFAAANVIEKIRKKDDAHKACELHVHCGWTANYATDLALLVFIRTQPRRKQSGIPLVGVTNCRCWPSLLASNIRVKGRGWEYRVPSSIHERPWEVSSSLFADRRCYIRFFRVLLNLRLKLSHLEPSTAWRAFKYNIFPYDGGLLITFCCHPRGNMAV